MTLVEARTVRFVETAAPPLTPALRAAVDDAWNADVHSALVQLMGKPIAESHALVVPTAQWGHPMCGPASVRNLVAAEPAFRHLSGLCWASLGVLELTALPTIGTERWVPWIRQADVLLIDGGEATYLCHWMRESGLGWPICCPRCPRWCGSE